jgi:hypothetical protein
MLQSGGIDSLVDIKADAYRSNPAALEKRYSQNQELMDLLAMQKLKSEKETASRDMALKAEQNPGTIAEQYEQQLVSMNKDEMAGQVAGVLKEKQKRTQQRQQAMGIANQPRPNMQGMASGGIVGYQEGGKLSRFDQALKALGMTAQEYKFLPQRQKDALQEYIDKEYVKQRKEFTVPEMPISKGIRDRKEATAAKKAEAEEAIKSRLGIPDSSKPTAGTQGGLSSAQSSAGTGTTPATGTTAPATGGIAATGTTPATAPAGTGTTPATGTTAPATGGIAATGTTPATAPAGTGTTPATGTTAPATGGIAATGQDMSVDDQLAAVLSTPAPDTSSINQTQLTDRLGEKFMGKLDDRMNVDPEEKKKEEITRLAADDSTKGGYGVKKYEEGLAAYLKQKEALDKAALDPEAVAKRRRASALEGLMVGGTSGSAAAARGRFDRDLAASKQGSILQQRDMFVKNAEAKNKVVKDINADAAKTFEVYTNDVAAAMNTIATVSKSDLELASKEADRMYQTNQNGIKNKIDAIRVSGEAKLRELVQQQASFQEISKALSDLDGANTALREEFYKSKQPKIAELDEIRLDRTSTPDEVALAEAQIAKYEAEFQSLKEKTMQDEMYKIYKEFMIQLKQQGGYTNQLTTSLQSKIQSTIGNASTTQTGGTSGQTTAQKTKRIMAQAGQSSQTTPSGP